MKKFLLFIVMVCSMNFVMAQTQTSATYSAGDIPVSFDVFDATCNGPVTPLVVNIPPGDFVFSVDVVYDMVAQGGAWMSEQRTRIYCQDTGLDEGQDFGGVGNAGTWSYSRTGLDIAEGVDADGVLTFEMRAFRTWGSANGGVCGTVYQVIPSGVWTITVNHGPPPSCVFPSALTVANATGTSIDFGWTENGTATTWDIEVVTAGTAPTGVATYNDVTTNPFTVTGLVQGTDYDLYVRADCGMDDTNTSIWVGPLFFMNSYCTPAPGSVDGNGITNVLMGTINNGTGAEPGNYGDYTALSTDAPQGLPLAIDITLETGFTYNLWAWVDWNNDLDFTDPGEEFYLGESTNINPTTFSGSITVPLTASLGSHRIRLGGADGGLGNTSPSNPCYTGAWSSFEDYSINVIAPPACQPVTNIVLSNIAPYSVDVAWTAVGGETVWDIEVVETGNAPTGIPTFNDVTNPFSVTGLLASTIYTIYVRADCAMDDTDVSIWIGSGTFDTPCVAIDVFPACEDFAGGTIPNCWTMTGTTPWLFSTGADYGASFAGDHTIGGGTNYAWVDASPAGPGEQYMLITPQYDVSSLTNPYLSFWVFSNNTTDPNENNSITVEMFDGANWVLTETIQGSNDAWLEYGVDVNATGTLTGNIVQFRFIFESLAANDFNNDMLVDDVCMDEAPSCPSPGSLTATNVTAGTADIDFNYSGPGTDFVIEYGPIGFIPGAGAGTEIIVNMVPPFTISGLPSSSDLQIFVKEICAIGDESDYAGPVTIQTACLSITTFPACEDFAINGIPNCWTMAGPTDWTFNTNGDYGAAFAGDHTTGGGTNYAWMDGSPAAPGNLYELYTPFYDVSSLNAPYLSYWVFTNNTDNPGDNNTLTVELWDGANWVLAETIQGDNPNWVEYTVDVYQLSSVTGDIQFRFVFESTAAINDFNNDILIDDVCLKELPLNDIGVTAIMTPISGCGLGLEDITIEITNLGFDTQGGFFTGYSVNNVVQTAVPDGFIAANIISGASETYTFSTQYDFSATGTYTLKAWTSLAGDSDATNDTTTVIITNTTVGISALPYFEDFETSDGGYVASNETVAGSTSVWEWGAPTGAVINTAGSGTNAWVTNLDGLYEGNTLTYLTAPCMDFSTLLVDPELSFALRTDSEVNWDGTFVEMSLDGGTTWNVLGSDADTDWYNNADQQFQGDNTAWTVVTHAITGGAGQGSVRLRFGFSSDGGVNFDGGAIDDVSIIDVCAAGFGLAATVTDESVEGTSIDGAATVTANVGSAYTYEWSNGGTTDTQTGLEAGTYYVTVTNSIGCKDELEIVVDYVCLANLVADVSYTEEAQNGTTNDGSITATANTSTGPYTFDWSTGTQAVEPTGVSTESGLTAGLYYVTITDANGCSEVDSIVVTAFCPVNLGSTAIVEEESVEGTADGSIGIIPTVGIAPFTYAWSNGGTTATQTDLAAGSYDVTITDANGCTEVMTIVIDFTCPTSIGASATGFDETIQGENDGVATATAAAGTPPYQFDWSNGATGNTVVNLVPGSYDVTVTDANGCMETTSVTINASALNTAIENIETLSAFNMAPNPTSGETVISVQFTENVDMRVEVISIVGQVINSLEYTQTTREDVMIDLTNVPSGIYFVRLSVGDAIHTDRIVKK